jgi:hypothetical protein
VRFAVVSIFMGTLKSDDDDDANGDEAIAAGVVGICLEIVLSSLELQWVAVSVSIQFGDLEDITDYCYAHYDRSG